MDICSVVQLSLLQVACIPRRIMAASSQRFEFHATSPGEFVLKNAHIHKNCRFDESNSLVNDFMNPSSINLAGSGVERASV